MMSSLPHLLCPVHTPQMFTPSPHYQHHLLSLLTTFLLNALYSSNLYFSHFIVSMSTIILFLGLLATPLAIFAQCPPLGPTLPLATNLADNPIVKKTIQGINEDDIHRQWREGNQE